MHLREKIAVMQAALDGKEIEYHNNRVWVEAKYLTWDWAHVKYRVKPGPPKTPIKIDWSAVNPKFQWVVKFPTDSIYLCEVKPVRKENSWYGGYGTALFNTTTHATDPGTCDWKDSLQERPRKDSKCM